MTASHHIAWQKLPLALTTTPSALHFHPISYTIRHPVPSDAAAHHQLAYITFIDTFANHPDNGDADTKAYTDEWFSVDKQLAEITSPELTLFVCERTDTRELVAYAQLRHNSTESCIQGQPTIELQRLYMLKSYHGCGIAQQLLQAAVEYSIEVLGCQSIWLGVWRYNQRAICYYLKSGFQLVGERQYRFGSHMKTIDVMELTLPQTGTANNQLTDGVMSVPPSSD